MVCLGFKPGTTALQAQTNPLSYGIFPLVYKLPSAKIKHSDWLKIVM